MNKKIIIILNFLLLISCSFTQPTTKINEADIFKFPKTEKITISTNLGIALYLKSYIKENVKALNWRSFDSNIGTIDSNGKFEGISEGFVQVYASDPDDTINYTFNVELKSCLYKKGEIIKRPNVKKNPINKIAFISNRENHFNNLYIMNSDGSEQTNLTNDSFDNSHLSWSPDNSKILYFGEGLFIINPDGTNKINLTKELNKSISYGLWSPDGTKILFIGEAQNPSIEYKLYTIKLDMTGLKEIFSTNIPIASLSWSPDGKIITFTNASIFDNVVPGDILKINEKGEAKPLHILFNNEICLKCSSQWYYAGPSWNNDNTLFFSLLNRASWEYPSSSQSINFILNPYDCTANELNPSNRSIIFSEYSPYESKIAFLENVENTEQIFIANKDGSNKKQLTNSDVPKSSLQWSPDGSEILFLGYAGTGEIYKVKADGSGIKRLTDNYYHDSSPVWSN